MSYKLSPEKQNLITIARSWLGTKWMHNQCKKGVGVDCVNFVWAVAKEADLKCKPLPKRFNRLCVLSDIEDYLNEYFDRVDVYLPADVICLEIKGYRTHTAYVTDKGMIHASVERGEVVEHTIDQRWERKITGIWRLYNG